jgi:hypothetical protein
VRTIEDIRFCSSALRGRACKPDRDERGDSEQRADWGAIIAALGTVLNLVSKLAKKSARVNSATSPRGVSIRNFSCD